MMTFLRRSLLFILLAAALAACGGDPATSADLEFTDVWSRQPAEGQFVSAVYGTVTNTGDTDVRITGASTDLTELTELHEVISEDGLMTMREREDGFVVPAGGTFTFEPGGPHVMLREIDPATYPTDAVDVTFTFDAGEPTFVTAEVRSIAGGDMGDMEMDDGMDDGMDGMEMDDE